MKWSLTWSKIFLRAVSVFHFSLQGLKIPWLLQVFQAQVSSFSLSIKKDLGYKKNTQLSCIQIFPFIATIAITIIITITSCRLFDDD